MWLSFSRGLSIMFQYFSTKYLVRANNQSSFSLPPLTSSPVCVTATYTSFLSLPYPQWQSVVYSQVFCLMHNVLHHHLWLLSPVFHPALSLDTKTARIQQIHLWGLLLHEKYPTTPSVALLSPWYNRADLKTNWSPLMPDKMYLMCHTN